MTLIALTFLHILLRVEASLVASYPVNAQLPPVARVAQPFEFQFSQGTFGGAASDITYSLSNAPSWLYVNSENRTISGTPQKDDVGTPGFNLLAADQSGSASMQVTLVVTPDDGPRPGIPLSPQLQDIGPTSAPSCLIIHSGDSFSFSFDSETFSNARPSTVYYGTSSPDNAPLPSWVKFDQSSLRFYGTAPNIGPQTFAFNLVASDVSGFSAATMVFEVMVSPHVLSFNQSAQTVFVTRGGEFSSLSFVDTLTLDGQKPGSTDLTQTNAESPNWLSFDRQTLKLHGTPPSDANNENVTISVKDIYQDVATLVVTLQYSQFFTDDVVECEAVVGQYFTFVFNTSILTNDASELDVDLGGQFPWLHYNRDNKTLYGQVPSDLDSDKMMVSLTAREGTAEDTRQFTINIVAGDGAGGQGLGSAVDPNSHGYREKKAGIIAMSVFIPVGLVSIILIFLYCRRRRQKRATHGEDKTLEEKPLPPRPDGPGLQHCQPFEATIQRETPIMDRPTSPSSKAPRLELEPWWNSNNLNEGEQNQDTRGVGPEENTFATSTIGWDFAALQSPEQDENKPPENTLTKPNRLSFQSSPPMRRRTSNNSGRREPLKPIQPRRSLKRNSALSSRSKRYSKRSSGISSVASGLPIRFSGAGHGAGGFGPPGHGVVRVSWQNTQASLQSDESSVGNLTPLFPRPPPRKRDSREYPKRMSLRPVDRDSLTISEADSLDAFVQGRAKCRNSSNPMFSGQISTRRVSSGLRALERARSNASRADTINSSIFIDECRRRSIIERPVSMMSGSIYTDDNRHSTYLRSLSEESPIVRPLAPIAQGHSQSSLAQNYSNIITPLPRFFSELSLNNAKQDENGGVLARNDPGYWSQPNQCLQKGVPMSRSQPFQKSPSTCSIPYDGKARRISLIKLAERDSSYPQGFQRDLTGGSVRSEIAFV